MHALKVSENDDIIDVVVVTLRLEADMWTAMDRWPMFVDALMERHEALDARGRHHAALTALLLDLARKGRLLSEDADDVRAVEAKYRTVWSCYIVLDAN